MNKPKPNLSKKDLDELVKKYQQRIEVAALVHGQEKVVNAIVNNDKNELQRMGIL